MSKKTRETTVDDAPEITPKGIDRAVKRKGLKEENPFDVLARQALAESRAGKTVTLEEFERQMKKRAIREPHKKAVRRLKNT